MSDHTLHLMTDSCGPYGLKFESQTRDLVFMVRPDRVLPPERSSPYFGALLHAMPRAAIADAIEYDFTNRLRDSFVGEEVDVARSRYFAAQSRARAMTNALIKELYQSADQGLLRIARKFSPANRLRIYIGCVWGGERVAQMAEVFPLLALAAIHEYHFAIGEKSGPRTVFNHPAVHTVMRPKHDPEPFEMIKAGAPMREIARRAGLDPAFRRIKPAAISDAESCVGNFDEMPRLVRDYLPDELPAQRRFFAAIRAQRAPSGRAWTAAQHKALGKTKAEVHARSADLDDWIRASEIKRIASSDDGRSLMALLEGEIQPMREFTREIGAEFITRYFNPRMSSETVFRLSDEWHEEVSQGEDDGSPKPLPPAWLPGDEINGIRVEPIADTSELHRSARYMHNCAVTYREAIERQECCLFIAHQGDAAEPAAMVELQLRNGKPIVAQLKARFNAEPDKCIKTAVSTWLRRKRSEFKLPTTPPAPPIGADMASFIDIPF